MTKNVLRPWSAVLLGFVPAMVLGLVTLNVSMFVQQEALAAVGMPAPEIISPTWLNSTPKRLADLRGNVVLVEFWTFGCYNCRNVEPYVKAWHKKYAPQGLVVIGVHSPEFNYERDIENVKRHIRENDIQYAVPIDNDFTTWNRFGNHYWPAMYLIDKRGIIRYVRVGEGGYGETEDQIRHLLAER